MNGMPEVTITPEAAEMFERQRKEREAREPKSTERDGRVIRRQDRDAYDRISRVNWSTLSHMARSPLHYQHKLTAVDHDTDARKVGRACHIAIYEPEEFQARVVKWDGGTRRGKEWDAFRAANAGREILTENEYDDVIALQRAVRANATAMAHLSGPGDAEVTVTWTHRVAPIEFLPGWSIECKGRLDWAGQKSLVDLKTVRDASPTAFGRAVHAYQWHVQAAMYVDAWLAATGDELPYVLIAAEKSPPKAVAVYRVPESILELGRQEYRRLLAQLHVCRETNSWPGYFEGEADLELPRWAIPYDDEEDAADLGLVIGG